MEGDSRKSSELAGSNIFGVGEAISAFQESCRNAQLRLEELRLVPYIPTLFVICAD